MTANGNFYITTAIPYVNAEPHLGHALELVQADVLARHRRLRGQPVRFLTGTDDHALKNVTAARAAGQAVRGFVDANAARFRGLREPLGLSFDDFISTSADPRHRSGVERLWRQCTERGDLYVRHYRGLYCPGCEQFYAPAELDGGVCAEHRVTPEPVTEQNWFFPALPLHRRCPRCPAIGAGPRRAGHPPQRGAGLRPGRAGRLQRLPPRRPGRRVGDPRAG